MPFFYEMQRQMPFFILCNARRPFFIQCDAKCPLSFDIFLRNSAGWNHKNSVKINEVMPSHPSTTAYQNDHAVYIRYHCIRECKGTKHAMHFFQSKLTMVWYGERSHSHAVAISTQHTHLHLPPDVSRDIDHSLLQFPANYVHHEIQGMAQLSNLTPEQSAALPTKKQLTQRRATLVKARNENDLTQTLDQYP
jgi:hypothetical protein